MANKRTTHPYHYSVDKNLLQVLVDFGLPVGLFLLFFYFYNFGKITPSEMVKTSGLLSISLLGITLIIGPLCKVIPSLDFLKAHRKFWGITAALAGLTHAWLVVHFFMKYDFSRLFNPANPKFYGLMSGLMALVILLLVTLSSSTKIVGKLNPKLWKAIQLTSYLAMILAVSHFYLMETKDGVLVIKRLLGRITFWFSAAVIIVRVLIIFWPSRKMK